QERRELMLEAASAFAQRRDAGEHVREITRVVAGAPDGLDESRAGLQARAGAGSARRRLEEPAQSGAGATGDRPVAGTHVLRHDGDVNVRQARWILQPRDEGGKTLDQ